jgi:outer membrane protein assembly factor BamB
MPVKPVAIGIAVVALAFAIWLIIGGIRRHRWLSLLRIPPILCCLILVAFLVPTIFGLGAPHPFFNKPAPAAAASVLFFRVTPNPNNNSSMLVAVSAQTGTTLWQRSLQGPITTFVSDDGHNVYTTESLIHTASTSTTTTAITARSDADGSVLWQVSLANMSVTTTPVVADGVLYFEAFQLISQKPTQLFALRAADGGTLWSIPVADSAATSLSIHPEADTLYTLSSGSSDLQARRTDTGKLLWTQTVDAWGIVAGPNAVYTYSQYGRVTARSAQTGAELWSFGNDDVFHSAVFAGDTLYVSAQHTGNIGDANGKLINPETVYALDATSGALRWKFATQSYNSGVLAAGAGDVYIKADDGIHALRASDGAVLWQNDPHKNWSFASLTPVLGSVLYITDIETLPPDTIQVLGPSKGQTYVYAINTADGTAYWGATVGPVLTIYPHWVL